MASRVETAFGNLARGPLFTFTGTAATYFALGAASGTSCTVIVEPQDGLVVVQGGDALHGRPALLRVRESEIASPQVGGRFVVGDDDYAIEDPPTRQAGVWQCRGRTQSRGVSGAARRSGQ